MVDLPRIDVQTTHGNVPLWGDFAIFDASRPLILSIGGAFAAPDYLHALPRHLPGCDVVFARLPGMHAPFLSENSVETFAESLDQAALQAFPGRRFLRLGSSIGGLTAMAMRTGSAFVALDPPLRTKALWPMRDRLRAVLQTCDPRMADWIWSVFGISNLEIEERDYRPLLDALNVPGLILAAGETLEPERPVDHLPGLICAADRIMLVRRPQVKTIFVAGSGHNIPRDAPAIMLEAIQEGLCLSGHLVEEADLARTASAAT